MASSGGIKEFDLETGQEEVDKWTSRIVVAKRAHQENFKDRAERNIDYYLGVQFPNDEGGGHEAEHSRVPLNFIASVVDSLVPAVYTRNPKALVRPKTPDKGNPEANKATRRYARMFQALLNKTMDEIGLKRTMKKVIKDGTLTGRGFVKIGYSAQFGKREGKKYSFLSVLKKIPGVPSDANMEDTYVKKNRVWAERVSPFKFFYDIDAQDLDHAAWCVQEIVLPMHRVVNNPIYKSIRKQLKPSSTVSKDLTKGMWEDVNEDSEPDEFPRDVQRITLYEIWDKESRRVRVIAKGNEDLGFLRDDPWPFKGLEGFPFREYMSINVPDSQWATSEVDRIIEGQDEFNIIREMQFKHTRRAMGGWITEKGNLEDQDLAAWREQEIMETFLVRDVNKIKSLVPPSMPTDYFSFAQELKKDLAENSKLPSWKRAGEKIGARSATEVNEIAQGIDVITNEKVDVTQDFTIDVLKGLAQLMQEFYTLVQVVPVVGEMGIEWKKFTPAEIKEELEIKIIPYSAVPINPNQELAHYREFLGVMIQAAQSGVPVNMVSFLQKFAQKLQIDDFDEFLGPESLEDIGGDPGKQAALAQALSQGGQGQQNVPAANISAGVTT